MKSGEGETDGAEKDRGNVSRRRAYNHPDFRLHSTANTFTGDGCST